MSAFLDLHVPGRPLLMPNPWDIGSARLLEAAGFRALATTSSGFAASLGRLDGQVSRKEAIAHAAAIAAAVDVPVSADLEHCFADDPEGVAATVRLAVAAGLAGCSVEDATGRDGDPLYDIGLATERVFAAVEAAGGSLVITARAEGLFHGASLDAVIGRLQRFQDAGAQVLFAPGLATERDVETVLGAVDRPINVLAWPGLPPVPRLAELGVARISVGGALANAAYGALVTAAEELLDTGTDGYRALAEVGGRAAAAAFRAAPDA
ncbi:isocitrate lyase/PEP mutase family protein [Nocardioides sp.]|uniref:isocitrate lyase/PEP mutase family protein n=1 Tax=Nocardioides sp. TaxID=35761 RepID=UPI0039E2183F